MNEAFQTFLRDASIRATRAREAAGRLTTSPEVSTGQGQPPETAKISTPEDIHAALLALSEPLGRSYAQVQADIADTQRSSWAGTAHEIREILASTLRLLAPDAEVTKQAWYKPEPNTSGPTHKQRARFILSQHSAGSKEHDVVSQVEILEELIGGLVRATYSRASDAAHRFKQRSEVKRVLRYFDAFAHDLLNLP